MEKFFVFNGKKHVMTREFKRMNNHEVYQRIDIYDKNEKKVASNFYSPKQVDDMLIKAAKQKKK